MERGAATQPGRRPAWRLAGDVRPYWRSVLVIFVVDTNSGSCWRQRCCRCLSSCWPSCSRWAVQEALGALRVVSAFGQEDGERDRFSRRSWTGVQARIRLVMSEGIFGLLVNLVTAVGTAAVLFIGVIHVQQALLTHGELLAREIAKPYFNARRTAERILNVALA